jgi:3-hydroxyisobutyrate dehydrogenase-like beta-hydroxyacid dehydrogenase
MDAGVVGLGQMGCAIARRLIQAKHRVTVYNRTRGRAEQLRSSGAIIADSPAAASTGDAVITMLADDAAVLAMALGKDGVLQGMHENPPQKLPPTIDRRRTGLRGNLGSTD